MKANVISSEPARRHLASLLALCLEINPQQRQTNDQKNQQTSKTLLLPNFRWVLLLSEHQVILADALRKNHTWDNIRPAQSIRDVGVADRCESVAANLCKRRVSYPWLCPHLNAVVTTLPSDRVTAIRIIPKATSSTK
jgi:hypothetical protein